MKILSLKLRNFRNIKNLSLSFSKNLNIFLGENGQGKTNLIEAMIYLSTCKSHRVDSELLLVNKESTFFDIQANVSRKVKKSLRVFYNEQGKSLFINNHNIQKVSEFIGNLNAILFSPDDLNLFSQTPKYRRRFVDMEIGKISLSYTKLLNEYTQLLKNRNSYLKNEKLDIDYLNILTEKMVDIQILIIQQRRKFLEDLLVFVNSYYQEITKSDRKIICEYKNSFECNYIKEDLLNKYQEYLQKDIKYKQTLLGIHKDDFIFKVDSYLVIDFLSQGQKRIVLLCLKLGLINMIYQLIHEYPILLLDDIFSELDELNQLKILKYIPKNVQIFITSCDFKLKSLLSKDCDIFEIENGFVK